MSEAIERAAEAVYAKTAEFEQLGVPWEQVEEYLKEQSRDFARAAIEAIREPTEAMSDQIIFCELSSIRKGEDLWRAMIDAALSRS